MGDAGRNGNVTQVFKYPDWMSDKDPSSFPLRPCLRRSSVSPNRLQAHRMCTHVAGKPHNRGDQLIV
jgi:hypothetical protein